MKAEQDIIIHFDNLPKLFLLQRKINLYLRLTACMEHQFHMFNRLATTQGVCFVINAAARLSRLVVVSSKVFLFSARTIKFSNLKTV